MKKQGSTSADKDSKGGQRAPLGQEGKTRRRGHPGWGRQSVPTPFPCLGSLFPPGWHQSLPGQREPSWFPSATLRPASGGPRRHHQHHEPPWPWSRGRRAGLGGAPLDRLAYGPLAPRPPGGSRPVRDAGSTRPPAPPSPKLQFSRAV